jgi:uncharacterized protein (DUF2384 family)
MVGTAEKKKIGPAGLRAFFKIAELWSLTKKEQIALLGLSESSSSIYNWKKDPDSSSLDRDQLTRLSLVLGIFKDLQILFADQTTADDWLRRPNSSPLFKNAAPIDFLRTGDIFAIYQVRHYLINARNC